MAKTPKNITKVTAEEVERNSIQGPRRFKWDFPEEVFDGDWWLLEVATADVNSVVNSFRNQAGSIYGKKATAKKHAEGKGVHVRMTEKEATPAQSSGRKS